ncbi:MAG: SDR family oxidoreductase [Magnetococcales bacterium]|nr:SDR family oxidoreductase [Magnetococcales bacterium]
MDLGLAGKTALVTGASRGIGLAIATALHREGCRVALNGRTVEPLQQAVAALGEGASYHPGDVTDPKACANLISSVGARWGGLDVLVCNVGSGASVPPGQETPPEWQRVLEMNLYGATHMVAAARKSLGESRGVVLCLSSICGLAALGAPITYSAAKAALNAYVRGMARPLGQEGVRINALAPGNVWFEGGTWERKLGEDRAGVQEMLQREVALGRLGELDEIADFAVFLTSARASFATGAVFVLDGGQLRG